MKKLLLILLVACNSPKVELSIPTVESLKVETPKPPKIKSPKAYLYIDSFYAPEFGQWSYTIAGNYNNNWVYETDFWVSPSESGKVLKRKVKDAQAFLDSVYKLK